MQTPLFSILVANYNNGKYFKDCYDSLISQTYENWEAIIVDDCSTDDSIKTIKELISEDPRFKLYENEKNRGCGFTKRRCAELATGEICGFVDPDDAIEFKALEIMVQKHLEYPNASMIYSNYIFHDANMKFIKIQKNSPIINKDPYFFNLNFLINHFATFKNSLYKNTEGISSKMKRAVDMDLYFKLYEKGDLIYIDENLYNYRIHNGGISTNENSNKAYFWHWAAIIEAAKRRNINIENNFVEEFIKRQEYDLLNYKYDLLKKSRFIKLGQKFGFLNWFK